MLVLAVWLSGNSFAAALYIYCDVEVSGPKKVIFRGTEMSLTRVTRDLLGLSYSVQPTPSWQFNGELLQDIYNRTYVELDE